MQPGLQAAAANYPPMILGNNVHATNGQDRPLACAAPGAKVEQKGGSVFCLAEPTRPTPIYASCRWTGNRRKPGMTSG